MGAPAQKEGYAACTGARSVRAQDLFSFITHAVTGCIRVLQLRSGYSLGLPPKLPEKMHARAIRVLRIRV